LRPRGDLHPPAHKWYTLLCKLLPDQWHDPLQVRTGAHRSDLCPHPVHIPPPDLSQGMDCLPVSRVRIQFEGLTAFDEHLRRTVVRIGPERRLEKGDGLVPVPLRVHGIASGEQAGSLSPVRSDVALTTEDLIYLHRFALAWADSIQQPRL